ncbi:MAG: thiamine ABC transporter ATP-binding protein [Pseudomonadota bacterium]
MLKLDAVSLAFDQFECRFDLSIEPSERVAVVGPSGGGKSTLLNLIAGFLSPDSGDIHWEGKSIVNLAPHLRPLTLLFQDNNLFAHLDVQTNLALGVDPRGRIDHTLSQKIGTVLERVGLADFRERLPTTLSGGQQQRVALARCLLRAHPMMLLDEPFSALDEATRESILALTDELLSDQSTTLLLVTHNSNDAARLGARLVNCESGRLVSEATQ